MVKIPYHTALRFAAFKRKLYMAVLPVLVNQSPRQKEQVAITVYAMSCERDLPEQVVSIHSFLRNVGVPKQFIVVSDGSYTSKSISLLERISPSVKVLSLGDVLRPDVPESIKAYAESKPLGKKLAILWSIPIDGTTVFTDSDVLFFRHAAELVQISQLNNDSPWYLPDLPGALDERMLRSDREKLNPINSGFIVLKKRLNWDLSSDRLAELDRQYNFFTEQTIMHLTLHNSGARPLDPDRFIVQTDDQFNFRDAYAGKNIALRHYVTGVRHKFWQAGFNYE